MRIIYKNVGAIIALHDQSVKDERTLSDVGKVIDYLGRIGY